MHEISLAHQTSHIGIFCNRREWQILYHLTLGITAKQSTIGLFARPEVGIPFFLLMNKHGAVDLPDEALHNLSFLTIVVPEVHITTQNKLCPCGR